MQLFYVVSTIVDVLNSMGFDPMIQIDWCFANGLKHVETCWNHQSTLKCLEKLTFRLVKHVCAWNLPCYLLGHFTPLMWNPLGKRLFWSFLINHLSRSMVLAVQRTFLSNPKPSPCFCFTRLPQRLNLEPHQLQPHPPKTIPTPQKITTASQKSQKSTQKISPPSQSCHIFQFFPLGPGAPGRVPGASAPGKSRRAAPGLEWCGAGLAASGGAGAAPPWDPQRFRGSLGTKFGFLLGEPPGFSQGFPEADFRWFSVGFCDFEERHIDIRDCGSAQWCAWGKAFSSLAKPLSTIMFFNAVCTLLFCFGIQHHPTQYTKHTPKMEVHDWLVETLGLFFCLFSLGFWFLRINPDESKPNLIHLAPQGILVKSKFFKKNVYMLNMRSIPWGCAIFLFRCEAFGNLKLCF